MALSMTGFGGATEETADRLYAIELRSVNHRYCDVRTHMPSDLSALGKSLEGIVRKRIARGRVDVTVSVTLVGQETVRPRIDLARARGYAEAFRELTAAIGSDEKARASQIFTMPGVLESPDTSPNHEEALKAIEPALQRALDDLVTMRRAEGEALARDLTARLEAAAGLAKQVGGQLERAVEDRKRKLEQRLKDLLDTETVLDPARLAQEVAIIADRVDVTEELERLDSHCNQFSRLLSKDEPVGRKLDFLIQEMNREANTIGSKCSDAAVAHVVVDLKAELERMREQIQNVE